MKQGFAGSGPKRALFAQFPIFDHKMHFLAKMHFWSKKAIFGAKLHFCGPVGSRDEIVLGVCEFVHSRNGTFCQKIKILRKWCPGGQKVQKSHFLHFWAQKWKITQKVHLGAKGVKFHPNSIGKTMIRGQMQNRDILSIHFSQQRNSANCEFHLGSFLSFCKQK